jgi:hypothetical protein
MLKNPILIKKIKVIIIEKVSHDTQKIENLASLF